MCSFLSYNNLLGAWSSGRSYEEGSWNDTQEDWLSQQRFKATGTELPEKGMIFVSIKACRTKTSISLPNNTIYLH